MFKIFLLYYSGIIIIKFIREITNKDDDNISDTSHQIGFLGGILTYCMSFFV